MKTEPFSRTPRLTAHAHLVLRRRYLRRNADNRVIETPARMFARVAKVVAQTDAMYGSSRSVKRTAARFYDMMAALDFLPNSPTLMNAGRELGQLSACFVLPVEDSIESIFNAVRDTALIHKSGGGTGFSFSAIRPARDVVKSTHGVSSGPLSFMNVFDVATETIKQGGTRRGANMGLLSVHHPDIMDFIKVKAQNPWRFVNFNLSVLVTSRFMKAVLDGKAYDLVNPHSGRRQARLAAGDVFAEMVKAAWACGDPGLVFIDRINETNPLPLLGRIEATNPCGEQPLLPYESCNLGSINLSRFVKQKKIDYARLGLVIRRAVHFLDNVIDINRFPLPQIREMTRKNRKIGLGIMGLADMFIRLGLPYDSPEALDLCGKLMAFIQTRARAASADLARKRGNFPSFAGSLHQRQGRRYMRNATTTTLAPTGTLSMIANCSSGIEPIFAVAYKRRILDGR
ncbi:MAG: adenosylcobalamin-dependent ribonucleoside-diphosphate reductase, partial [Thermodesulfobacteriota bacterium]|nr:adenosylcobalamin-dependent ribonucleoside-diphosphate reductase [Thermodesulfobacteriota bacterium]